MTNFKLVKLLNYGIHQEQKRTSLKYEKQTPVDIYFLWYVKIQGQKISIQFLTKNKRKEKKNQLQFKLKFNFN